MVDENKLGPVARRLAATQRVLCVEDEADIAAFLRAYFRAAGYDVVHIDPDSVDAVLAGIDEHRPDAVLLDVHLRGFSGLEAYRLMRSRDDLAFMPVILVSADPAADPDLAAQRGLDAFVAKPFNTNVLADLVRIRLASAERLASRGRHADTGLMTHEYVEARLTDEVSLAGTEGTVSFALVRLLSMLDIVAEVGREGLNHLATSLVRAARTGLPTNTVLGLTTSDELAVVFPTLDIDDATAALEPVLRALDGTFEFPGGATVPVDLAAGVAAYPDNATDSAELFMAADAALTAAVESRTLLHRAL